MKLEIASATDPGVTRMLNEDKVLALAKRAVGCATSALLMVSDGMGGYDGGEIASALAIETVRIRLGWPVKRQNIRDTQPLPKIRPSDHFAGALATKLQLAVEEANSVIVDYAAANKTTAARLGATTTVMAIEGDEAYIANVGDSRAYLLRDNELLQITDDHSYVAQLVRIGELSAESMFDHPNRSVITRALGNKETLRVDVKAMRICRGDTLLLCTDGLWEMVRSTLEIAEIVSSAATAQVAANQLVSRANHYGGEDNIGVVVARVS